MLDRNLRAEVAVEDDGDAGEPAAPGGSRGHGGHRSGMVGAPIATSAATVPREVELVVEALGPHAEGIAALEGAQVHVPFALPGERVRARVWRQHDDRADADLLSVLAPAPARIAPGCPRFGVCGGCQLQSLPYRDQLAFKTELVRRHFRAAGHSAEKIAPCVASPREYGYRSKITPHYEPARAGKPLAIGFLRQGRRHDIVDVPHCPIATDAINASLPDLRAAATIAAVGRRRGASLLLRDTLNGVTSDPDARVRERVGTIELEFSAREFFQNNPFLLPTLVDFVVEQAAATGASILVDTYSGSGLFALSAARRFARVFGVEVSTVAVAAARANAARNRLDNVELVAASAAQIFASLPATAVATAGDEAVVIVDPPRKGVDDSFLAQLVEFGPRAVVYVACDPETAARDTARLVATSRLRLMTVQPFDMFPQTRHVECVSILHRT